MEVKLIKREDDMGNQKIGLSVLSNDGRSIFTGFIKNPYLQNLDNKTLITYTESTGTGDNHIEITYDENAFSLKTTKEGRFIHDQIHFDERTGIFCKQIINEKGLLELERRSIAKGKEITMEVCPHAPCIKQFKTGPLEDQTVFLINRGKLIMTEAYSGPESLAHPAPLTFDQNYANQILTRFKFDRRILRGCHQGLSLSTIKSNHR